MNITIVRGGVFYSVRIPPFDPMPMFITFGELKYIQHGTDGDGLPLYIADR